MSHSFFTINNFSIVLQVGRKIEPVKHELDLAIKSTFYVSSKFAIKHSREIKIYDFLLISKKFINANKRENAFDEIKSKRQQKSPFFIISGFTINVLFKLLIVNTSV